MLRVLILQKELREKQAELQKITEAAEALEQRKAALAGTRS